MKRKILVLLLAAAMVFALCACGGSDSEGGFSSTTSKDAKDLVAEYYEFELDGKSYALPCPLSEVAANGWYISELEEYDNLELDPKTYTLVYAYKDSNKDQAAFMMQVTNSEDASKPLGDCMVTSVEVDTGYLCAANSLTLKKAGVTIDISTPEAVKATAEALKSAYGTDENVFRDDSANSNYEIQYRWTLSNLLPEEEQEETYVMGMEESTSIQDNVFAIDFAGRVQ